MAALDTQTHKQRYRGPSFSSSLLDAIYRSIDETRVANDHQESKNFVHHRRKDAEEDIESLRRAIMVEKWIESYTNSTITPTRRHFPSNSASSTDSSMFSSSETDSPASRSSPSKPKQAQPPQPIKLKTGLNREGRFTKTKSNAHKIYGELKKVKEPISPGGKITNFLNSIFSPRNLKTNQGPEEWGPMRKSKSMKDNTSSLASRSCLSKNVSSGGNKSKRSVRFCPVGVIVDEDCQPCGHKNIYDDHEYSICSQFIKKNIDSFRVCEGENVRKHEYRDEDEYDFDDMSCGSSDLFELENIGRVGIGIGSYEEELPVYGTTSLGM